MKLPKIRKFNRNRSRYLFIVALLCITLGIVVGALAFTARSQSHKTGPTSNDVSADQSNAVSIPSTSPKADPTSTATPAATPTQMATPTSTPTSSAKSSPTPQKVVQTPVSTPPVQPSVYANVNHSQYCDGNGNGTVEYISSILFSLSGSPGQPTTLTYVIETQSGSHPEISYPMNATIPAGGYNVNAQSPSQPGPLLIFTFDNLDEPDAIRVRVTSPYSFTGSWQSIQPAC